MGIGAAIASARRFISCLCSSASEIRAIAFKTFVLNGSSTAVRVHDALSQWYSPFSNLADALTDNYFTAYTGSTGESPHNKDHPKQEDKGAVAERGVHASASDQLQGHNTVEGKHETQIFLLRFLHNFIIFRS